MEKSKEQSVDPLQMTTSFETDLCELVTYTTAVEDGDNDWDYNFENDNGASPIILLADGTPVQPDDQDNDQTASTSDSPQLSLVPMNNLINPSLKMSNEPEQQQPTEVHVNSSTEWKKPMADDCVGAYSCGQCSFSCDDQDALREHTAQHATSATLHCVYCSYKTISETHFARHITDHEIEKAALERGDELGHGFIFGAVTEQPQEQTRLHGEEDDDWQMGCSQEDPLDVGNSSRGSTNNVGHAIDSLPSVYGQQTSSASKTCSTALLSNVADTQSPNRKTSKRKIASRDDVSPSTRPLTDSRSTNLIANGHDETSDSTEATMIASVKKKAKITDYFGAVRDQNRPVQSSSSGSSKSIRKTAGKWRCPHCPYSSKRKFVVEKHLISHDLDHSSKENSFEAMSSNEALLQPKDEVEESVLPSQCSCDENDYDQENFNSVDLPATSEMNGFNCSEVSESPLQTYLSKNRLDNNSSSRDLFTFSSRNQENEFENITLLDCPFCPVRSRNQIAHENHITLCHIDDKNTIDKKDTDVQGVQASPSPTRVSSRPSTSRYKKPSLQVTGSQTDGRNYSDFIELFDSDDSDPEFTGFHNTLKHKPAEHSSRNLSPKLRAVHGAQSPVKRQSVGPKSTPTYQHGFKPTTQLNRSPSKQARKSSTGVALISLKNSTNAGLVSTTNCRVIDNSLDCNYCCPLCPFNTILRIHFLNHVDDVHSPGEVFVCRTCSFTATSAYVIETHRKETCPNSGCSRVSLHLCPNCPFQSIYYNSFERHLLNCSKVLSEEGYNRNGKHMCPFCHYKTFEIELYKEHLLNHIRSEALSCPRCPFKTSRKDMYRWHLKMEHGYVRGKYRCTPCDYVTINYQQYMAHMSSHFPTRKKVPRVPLPPSLVDLVHQQYLAHLNQEPGLLEPPQSDDNGEYNTFAEIKYTPPQKKYKSNSVLKKRTNSANEHHQKNLKAFFLKKSKKKRAPFIADASDEDEDGAFPITADSTREQSFVTTASSLTATALAHKESNYPKGKLSEKHHPKKRGRPRKIILPGEDGQVKNSFAQKESLPRKRGRPKKIIPPIEDEVFRSPSAATRVDQLLLKASTSNNAAAKSPQVPSSSGQQETDGWVTSSSSSSKSTSVTSPVRSHKTKPTSPQKTVVAMKRPAVRLDPAAPLKVAVVTKTPVCAASSFVCPFCSQVFTSNTQLVRHVAVHTDRGRMTCPVCNFSTMEFPALQSHLRSLHQELCF